METFAVGELYRVEKKKNGPFEGYVRYYKCIRRTEKSVWLRRYDNELVGESVMYRVRTDHPSGEYVCGRGRGNAKSVWYNDGEMIWAKDAVRI